MRWRLSPCLRILKIGKICLEFTVLSSVNELLFACSSTSNFILPMRIRYVRFACCHTLAVLETLVWFLSADIALAWLAYQSVAYDSKLNYIKGFSLCLI